MFTKPAALVWGSGSVVFVGALAATVVLSLSSAAAPAPAPAAISGQSGGNGNTGNGNGNKGNGNGNGGGAGAGSAAHPLTLTGTVSGQLAPGLPRVLVVTVDNAKNQAVYLKSVTAIIQSVAAGPNPSKPACNKAWFTVGSFSGSQFIGQGLKGQVQLPLTLVNLPNTNQDNCKGAAYSVAFTAIADQA